MSAGTYRGVQIPDRIQQRRNDDRHSPLFAAWAEGVDGALNVAVPLVESLHFDSPCSLDHHGYCQEHGHLEPGPCPDDAAKKFIAETKKDGTT